MTAADGETGDLRGRQDRLAANLAAVRERIAAALAEGVQAYATGLATLRGSAIATSPPASH